MDLSIRSYVKIELDNLTQWTGQLNLIIHENPLVYSLWSIRPVRMISS
jgi:hypothetical protein